MSAGRSATMEKQGQGTLSIEIPETAMKLQVQYIPWEMIFPDPAQPRVEADSELKASIAAGGIRQPITVRPQPGSIAGMFQIVDGERRWRGAEGVQMLIPCLVRIDMDDDAERVRTQLIANTGKALTPVEEARAMASLMTARGGSVSDLAAYLGKPVTTVSQRLNLMQLGPWLALIQKGLLKYTHAAEVLLPYRGCPDAVHSAVIEELNGMHLLVKQEGEESVFESSSDFEGEVTPLYRKHLYPIAKRKDDAKPAFDTTMHDRECACGGVEVKDWQGKRRHCGNPEWWQPREKAAKKEERAKQKAASEKSGAKNGAKAVPAAPKESQWERESRERREFVGRLREDADAIAKLFASAIKKLSAKAGGVLDKFLRQRISDDYISMPDKSAEKLVPRGASGDEFMRWLAFGIVFNTIDNEEYNLEENLKEYAKTFGVDVAAYIKRAKTPPAAADTKAATKKAGKK
jgi:ParB/RepB/Spo0J family partition protein